MEPQGDASCLEASSLSGALRCYVASDTYQDVLDLDRPLRPELDLPDASLEYLEGVKIQILAQDCESELVNQWF